MGKRGEMGPVGKETGACAGPVCGAGGIPQEESGKQALPRLANTPPTEKSAQRPAGGVRHAVSNRWGGRRPPTPGNAGCPERRIVCLPFFAQGSFSVLLFLATAWVSGPLPAPLPHPPSLGPHPIRAPTMKALLDSKATGEGGA